MEPENRHEKQKNATVTPTGGICSIDLHGRSSRKPPVRSAAYPEKHPSYFPYADGFLPFCVQMGSIRLHLSSAFGQLRILRPCRSRKVFCLRSRKAQSVRFIKTFAMEVVSLKDTAHRFLFAFDFQFKVNYQGAFFFFFFFPWKST